MGLSKRVKTARKFVSDGQLWVRNESKLYLDFYDRNTSFAQLVPIEALPACIYAPELAARYYGPQGEFEIIVRWLPWSACSRTI